MTPEQIQTVAARVRAERVRHGWTQHDLVARINGIRAADDPHAPPISQQWLSMVEHGTTLLTNAQRLAWLAAALELPTSALVVGAVEETPQMAHLRTALRAHGVSDEAAKEVVRTFEALERGVSVSTVTRSDAATPPQLPAEPTRDPDTDMPPRAR